MKKRFNYHHSNHIHDLFDSRKERAKKTNVTCRCGENKLFINYIDAPYCGNYIKITCPLCGTKEVFHDDYA